ncbi:MAG: glycosyltransferase [Anaerolineae bacterium]|nr:glycosyltransferase [Anaerolineae bacterium]MCZ7553561.1 glycosyltransferase [Anaerolineales bacterium]
MSAGKMDWQPLVSIITPSYNQGRFLEAALRSVLEQDYPRIEYIVIDGGSRDESAAILERYAARLAHWESTPDRGQAHAINKGLRLARGELLGWLNSDDELLPGALRRAVEAFDQPPPADVVYGRLERSDVNGRAVPTPALPKDRVVFGRERLLGECIVNQPGTLWRRSVMEKAGPLDETLHYALDYEFWMRLALAGARFKRLDAPQARFRLSPGSKTVAGAVAHADEALAVLEAYARRPDLPALTGLAASQLAAQAQRTRAVFHLLAANGELRRGAFGRALARLGLALRSDPRALFERRWLDLARARARRSRAPVRYNEPQPEPEAEETPE